jgi:hypothetical protein
MPGIASISARCENACERSPDVSPSSCWRCSCGHSSGGRPDELVGGLCVDKQREMTRRLLSSTLSCE